MTTFIFFQKAEWKRKMRELQGEHAAQKREVTLLGWSGGAGFPETSSYPTAPPSSTTTPLKPVGWYFVADGVPRGRPPSIHGRGQLPGQQPPWPGVGASGPFLLNPTPALLCGPLCRDPFSPPWRAVLETSDALTGHFMFGPFFETPPRREPGGCGPQPSFRGSPNGRAQILRPGNREQQASG